MLWIKTLPCGPFGTNAYLVGAENSKEALLIDAPPESFDEVMKVLSQAGRELKAVLITHPHFDHTMDSVIFENSGIPVYSHPEAIDGILNPQTFGLVPQPPGGFQGCSNVRKLEIGGSLELAGLVLGVLDVPGHSVGSVALFAEEACFVGDLIFRSSVGRTDLPGGDFEVLTQSILKNIFTLPDDTVIYPGHGPATSVSSEKAHNPYIRT